MRNQSLLVAAAAAIAPALDAAGQTGIIVEGEPFPELALPALDDGRPMSIADFRGQRVVLHVFASW